MHIAFFNRSYFPDETATGQLLTDLCEDLVRVHGCRVSVVTGWPGTASSDRGRRRFPRTSLFVGREDRHGVRIYRARGTRFDKRRFAGRASNYMTYFGSACWAKTPCGKHSAK